MYLSYHVLRLSIAVLWVEKIPEDSLLLAIDDFGDNVSRFGRYQRGDVYQKVVYYEF